MKLSTQQFRPPSKGKAWLEPVLFRSTLESDPRSRGNDVIKELYRNNLRPGNLFELLALGAQHPYEQCKYSIIALGTIANDYVPRLSSSFDRYDDRTLDLVRLPEGWLTGGRFLAFRR